MRSQPSVLLALLVVCAAPFAQIVTLDDSASPRQRVTAGFEWVVDRVNAETDPDTLFIQRGSVTGLEYRLDTSAFVGRQARIFLLFPRETGGLDAGGSTELSWRTRGTFIDGSVRQGERALIFEGTIPAAQMVAIFDLDILLDIRDLTGELWLEPRFVLEAQ